MPSGLSTDVWIALGYKTLWSPREAHVVIEMPTTCISNLSSPCEGLLGVQLFIIRDRGWPRWPWLPHFTQQAVIIGLIWQPLKMALDLAQVPSADRAILIFPMHWSPDFRFSCVCLVTLDLITFPSAVYSLWELAEGWYQSWTYCFSQG